jgi:hypothetical protein
MKIGEQLTIGSKHFVVQESLKCEGCGLRSFRDTHFYCRKIRLQIGECCSALRSDGKSIIFKSLNDDTNRKYTDYTNITI